MTNSQYANRRLKANLPFLAAQHMWIISTHLMPDVFYTAMARVCLESRPPLPSQHTHALLFSSTQSLGCPSLPLLLLRGLYTPHHRCLAIIRHVLPDLPYNYLSNHMDCNLPRRWVGVGKVFAPFFFFFLRCRRVCHVTYEVVDDDDIKTWCHDV